MHHFNQLYCTIIESTRRDFLKQVAGTVAAAAAPAAPAIAAAAPAVAAPTKFSMFAYDVGDAMDKHVLSSAIERYFSNKKLSKQQMNHRVQHMQQNIQSGKLNATTIKQLIALSDTSMEHFTSIYAAKMRHEIKQINNDIPIKIVADAINQYETSNSKDDMYEIFYKLQDQFMRNENNDLFNYLMPNEVWLDEKRIMTFDQAVDANIFKSTEFVNKMFNNMPQIKRDAQKVLKQIQQQHPQYADANDIEYSPMDYKGSWQHDADYQSLSMGESTIAEKSIHSAVRPGILKRQTSGKLTCTKARALKSKQKNKGNNTAKAAQRYINYHC